MKLASLWLHRCLTEHIACILSNEPLPALPSRILDVDAPHSPSKLSLVESSGRHGSYVTLSHVWGQQRVTTTTTANISERKQSILLDSLSQTFRDAVSIARKLDVRYIWIDSLCIIQDDPADWAIEASKMGSYYSNSLFTIAAVSGHDAKAGCFMPYKPQTLAPCAIAIGFPVSEDYPENTSGRLFGFIRPNLSWDPVQQTDGFHRPILWQRAWVLQERLLSPRLLLFSEMQMSWYCRSEEASERVPEGTSRFTDLKHGEKVLRSAILGLTRLVDSPTNTQSAKTVRLLDANIGISSNEDPTDLYNAWYDLVMLYGKCDLSVKSDIFPAISGIAQAIGKATGDEYYAGHWKNDLHRGLLWTAPDSTVSRGHLIEYRAPSWSWASLPATCGFYVRQLIPSGADTSCLRLKETRIRTDTADPFGRVLEGALILEGIMKRAHPRTRNIDGNEEAFAGSKESDKQATLFDLHERKSIGYYYPDNENTRHLPEVWCAPIMTEASYFTKHGPDGKELPLREARCWAMVCLNAEAQTFMRVGLAWVRDWEWFQNCSRLTFTIV